jgi:glycosyltransferase involved in cell wall biosynthesis
MNVFFLTHWYPTSESPVTGIFIREHARAISLYHKVFVVHVVGMQRSNSALPKIQQEDENELTVFRVGYPKPKIKKTSWFQRLRLVNQVFNNLSSSGFRPDIIHANVYNTADLAVILGRKYNLPAVLTEHSSSFPRHLLKGTKALSARFFVNQLQMVMPVSENLITHMKEYGIRGPFIPVSNTVNCELFHPDGTKLSQLDGIKRILAVSSLVEVKRIDLLLQSTSMLIKKGYKFHLLIVGNGPERDRLCALAQQLDITDQVSFLGQKNKPEVAEYMRQVDLLVLTSQWENQPVVILEALASGLPVVAPDLGGIPEILTGMCGRLAEPGSVQSIAEQIAYLLENLSDYPSQPIANDARGRFSYPAVGKAFSQIYEQVSKEFKQ